MSFHLALPFHEGETYMHKTLRVPNNDNPTSPFLSPFAARVLQRSPLVAVGTVDARGRPWTSLWGGEPAFCRPVAPSIIAIKTNVGRTHDPVVDALLGTEADGEVIQRGENGPLISGLGINLDTRSRIKFSGRMVAGALQEPEKGSGAAEVQLVMKIETSLGAQLSQIPQPQNHHPHPPLSNPPLHLHPLTPAAINLIHAADLFFLSSAHLTTPSTNHRGGPPGFLRILSNTATELSLIYPEYSGNNLYQTLGNFHLFPLASLLIPDFTTGNALYLTGRTEILIGSAASKLLPHTSLAVKFTVDELRLLANCLPFRASPGEPSPYNPRLRLLATEHPPISTSTSTSSSTNSSTPSTATLLFQTPLTPSISRFRFRLDTPTSWKAGQYVVFDFSDEFDLGYSHMRDDDPRSLNDDFIRTFTVSSSPSAAAGAVGPQMSEFDITIRKVGRATGFLFKQRKASRLTIPISGFGGEFVDDRLETEGGRRTVYIAAGVGITPFLAMLGTKIQEGVEIFWSVRAADLGLVRDTLNRVEGLGAAMRIFVTGAETGGLGGQVNKSDTLSRISKEGGGVWERRMEKGDLVPTDGSREGGGKTKWLLCASKSFRSNVLAWLDGESVLFEDFDF